MKSNEQDLSLERDIDYLHALRLYSLMASLAIDYEDTRQKREILGHETNRNMFHMRYINHHEDEWMRAVSGDQTDLSLEGWMNGLSVASIDGDYCVEGTQISVDQIVGHIVKGIGASYKLELVGEQLVIVSVDHHMGRR